jgi:hypothetical protein
MKLDVLDSLNLPGNPEKANEDAFAHRASAAVVLDGATGLGEKLLPGPSDAAWLARFAANRLMAYTGDGANAQAAVTAALFDAEMSFTQLRRRAPAETYEIPFASMMLAVLGEGMLDLVSYGDCAALIGRPDEPAEIVGEALARRARESARVRKLAESKGEAAAGAGVREIFLPALRAARNLVNTSRGGWLFGPDVTAADHSETRRADIPAGTHLLLVTDGFLALVSDYRRYDIDALLDAAKHAGLAALGRELRAVENDDPEGVQFPRFKKSDDATALLLQAVE